MSLAARPAQDSWWRKFTKARECPNNTPRNDNRAAAAGRWRAEDDEGQRLDCAVMPAERQAVLSSSHPWRHSNIQAINPNMCPGMSVLMGIPFTCLGLYRLVFASGLMGVRLLQCWVQPVLLSCVCLCLDVFRATNLSHTPCRRLAVT